MSKYQVGAEGIYHELGNRGRVRVLSCERVMICNTPATRVRLLALEQLEGSGIVKPIPAGHEWNAEESDDAGGYGGWFLEGC